MRVVEGVIVHVSHVDKVGCHLYTTTTLWGEDGNGHSPVGLLLRRG